MTTETPAAAADAVVADANLSVGTPTPADPSLGTPTPTEPSAPEPKAAEADPAPAADPKPEAEAPKPMDWRERRLGEVSAQKRALEEQLAAARRELEAVKAKPADPQAPKPEPKYTEEEVNRRAMELAQRQAAEARFTDRCNEVYNKGQEKFPDFQSTLASYAQLGGLQRPFVEAVLQAGDKAPEILHSLGKDLNEAARVMSLGPVEQAFEIARLATKLEAPKPVVAPAAVSSAPAPVKPKVGGGAKAEASVYDDSMSTADWIALRNKELRERRVH